MDIIDFECDGFVVENNLPQEKDYVSELLNAYSNLMSQEAERQIARLKDYIAIIGMGEDYV